MTDPKSKHDGENAPSVPAELEAARKEIEQLTEISKRALADLQNYRRRVEEERGSFAAFANASLILAILPILDNFSRAFTHMPEDLKNNEWVAGVMNMEKQLVGVLQKAGLAEMPSAVGQQFDTNKHEAVLTGPGEKDIVLEEFEKGYMLSDKVLRPAKVKVGDGEQSISQQINK